MINANIYMYSPWGNPEGINSIFPIASVSFEDTDLADDEHLYQALIRLEIHAPGYDVYFVWQDENLCYVNGSTDGKPLGEIRFKE